MTNLKNMTIAKKLMMVLILIAVFYLFTQLSRLTIGLLVWGMMAIFMWRFFASMPVNINGYEDEFTSHAQDDDYYLMKAEEDRVSEENRHNQEIADKLSQAATDRM